MNITWEEIIVRIRKDPAYRELVELAYFEKDLALNVERFRKSEEYAETLRLIRAFLPGKTLTLADIGAGNGIAAVSFALDGMHATAIEPDPSETIGAGAIRKLKTHYRLDNLDVAEAWGESLPFPDATFDVVYIRQAMHHAAELQGFVREASRLLKKGGLFMTVRDHVIYDEPDKEWFLRTHPLHRFYGGENAFTFAQYESAILEAGLTIRKVLRHYDSVINYFPEKEESLQKKARERDELVYANLSRKLPAFLASNSWIKKKYAERLERSIGKALDERKIPGRLISFIATKK